MRALIVEDDLGITGLLREGLEEEGYQVLIASDGPTGLDIGRTGQFDVIILDLMLPRLDAYEVAQTLRGNGIRTPIMMLTARDANGTSFEGWISGGMITLQAVFPRRAPCSSPSRFAPWSGSDLAILFLFARFSPRLITRQAIRGVGYCLREEARV